MKKHLPAITIFAIIIGIIGLAIWFSERDSKIKELVKLDLYPQEELSFLEKEGFLEDLKTETATENKEKALSLLKSPTLIEQDLNSPDEHFEVLATKLNLNQNTYQVAFKLENRSGQNKEFYLIPVSKNSQIQFQEIKGVLNNKKQLSVNKEDARKEPLNELYDVNKHKKELNPELAKAYNDIDNNNYQAEPIKITLNAKTTLLAKSSWQINGGQNSANLEPVYFLVYGSAGGMKAEINILNVYSHPQQGQNWEVDFTTKGKADLKIIPNDQATIDDDEFVGLWCGEEEKVPQILSGDVIYYPNWQCGDIAKVVHYTKKAGKHTLRFEFGGAIAYAHNYSTQAINIQRGVINVPNTGTTAAPGTNFGSLTSAFVLFKSNRYSSAGPSTPADVTKYVDDLSLRLELTAVDTITATRISTGEAANYRADWESWEYVGAAGGANEFIVRSRNTITLGAGTYTTSETLDNTPTNINKCIPFITGISNTQTGNDSNGLTATAWISGTNALNIERGGSLGTTIVQVVTVEFTGSNWHVAHGKQAASTADSGTMTLYEGADAATTAYTISNTANAFIAASQSVGDTNNTDDAIADNWPATYISSQTQVTWAYHSDHAVTNGNKQYVHVLENPYVTVTRFTNTGALGGDNNVDITSAGVTDLTNTTIFLSKSSSGTGNAFPRGWASYRITSTTNAAHWVSYSGNTQSAKLEIVEMPMEDVTAALSGTVTSSITENDIVAGGKTIILTLTGDTWVADGATFDAQRQNIINGLSAMQSVTSGPNNGATFVDDASIGTFTWSNPGNAAVSDDSYASVGATWATSTHYLKATGFGFSIPTGATVNGIKVEAEIRAQSANLLYDNSVKIVKGGTFQGTDNKRSSSTYWPTSDTYVSWGSTSDLWGLSWSAAEINASDFGVGISVYTGDNDPFVDHIRITVYYTPALQTYGWDAEVKAKIPVTDVVRTSNTVVTITLSAETGYDIISQETITATIPATALTRGGAIVATPTFTIDPFYEPNVIFKQNVIFRNNVIFK